MSSEVRQAYKDILGATRFESVAIGYSGSLSPHARAVRRLLGEPGAVHHFDRLWTDGTPVSRLYALAAYWYLAPERYADRLAAMRLEAPVSVDAQRGCIGERLTIGDLLDCDGRVRTRRHPLAPGSSATAAHCARRRNGNFCDDFSHGAAAIAIVEGTTIAEPRCSARPSTWPRVVVSADGRLCSRNYPVDLQVFATCESTMPD